MSDNTHPRIVQVADWVDDLTKDIDVAQSCPDCTDCGAPDGGQHDRTCKHGADQ